MLGKSMSARARKARKCPAPVRPAPMLTFDFAAQLDDIKAQNRG